MLICYDKNRNQFHIPTENVVNVTSNYNVILEKQTYRITEKTDPKWIMWGEMYCEKKS